MHIMHCCHKKKANKYALEHHPESTKELKKTQKMPLFRFGKSKKLNSAKKSSSMGSIYKDYSGDIRKDEAIAVEETFQGI